MIHELIWKDKSAYFLIKPHESEDRTAPASDIPLLQGSRNLSVNS